MQIATDNSMNSECRAEYEPPTVTNGNRATNRVFLPPGGLHDLGSGCTFGRVSAMTSAFLLERSALSLGAFAGSTFFAVLAFAFLPDFALFWLFCLVTSRTVLSLYR